MSAAAAAAAAQVNPTANLMAQQGAQLAAQAPWTEPQTVAEVVAATKGLLLKALKKEAVDPELYKRIAIAYVKASCCSQESAQVKAKADNEMRALITNIEKLQNKPEFKRISEVAYAVIDTFRKLPVCPVLPGTDAQAVNALNQQVRAQGVQKLLSVLLRSYEALGTCYHVAKSQMDFDIARKRFAAFGNPLPMDKDQRVPTYILKFGLEKTVESSSLAFALLCRYYPKRPFLDKQVVGLFHRLLSEEDIAALNRHQQGSDPHAAQFAQAMLTLNHLHHSYFRYEHAMEIIHNAVFGLPVARTLIEDQGETAHRFVPELFDLNKTRVAMAPRVLARYQKNPYDNSLFPDVCTNFITHYEKMQTTATCTLAYQLFHEVLKKQCEQLKSDAYLQPLAYCYYFPRPLFPEITELTQYDTLLWNDPLTDVLSQAGQNNETASSVLKKMAGATQTAAGADAGAAAAAAPRAKRFENKTAAADVPKAPDPKEKNEKEAHAKPFLPQLGRNPHATAAQAAGAGAGAATAVLPKAKPFEVIVAESTVDIDTLSYAPRVDLWFTDPKTALANGNYQGSAAYLKEMVLIHTLPPLLDRLMGTAYCLEGTCQNSQGEESALFCLTGEMVDPTQLDAKPKRGILSIAMDPDGTIWHRCWGEKTTNALVNDLILGTLFRNIDFPSKPVAEPKQKGIKPAAMTTLFDETSITVDEDDIMSIKLDASHTLRLFRQGK